MKNKISDLRNHMFAALERLNNEDLSPEDLKKEIERSQAISEIGKVIVDSAKTEVMYIKATRKKDNHSALLDASEADKFNEEPKKLERPPAEYSNQSAMGISQPGLSK